MSTKASEKEVETLKGQEKGLNDRLAQLIKERQERDRLRLERQRREEAEKKRAEVYKL